MQTNPTPYKWTQLEEMPDINLLALDPILDIQAANRVFASKGIRAKLTGLFFIHSNFSGTAFAFTEELAEISQEIIAKMTTDRSWFESYINEAYAAFEEFEILCQELSKNFNHSKSFSILSKNYYPCSQTDMMDLVTYLYEHYADFVKLHWIQNCADFSSNKLTEFASAIIKKRVESLGLTADEVSQAFSSLTTPSQQSMTNLESISLLSFTNSMLESDNNFLTDTLKDMQTNDALTYLQSYPHLINKLDERTKNFGWLGFGYNGPGWNKNYFLDIALSMLRQGVDLISGIDIIKYKQQATITKKAILVENLELNQLEIDIFQNCADIIYTKSVRKELMTKFYAVIDPLLNHLASLLGISIEEIKLSKISELNNLTTNSQIILRKEKCVFYNTDTIDSILVGSDAENWYNAQEFKTEIVVSKTNLKGNCAYPGKVSGKVKIVKRVSDMTGFEDGDILVSIATTPDLLPAMKRASAIITDVGGITCHAAIVARELQIPCVVGTKIATKLLGNGDLVEVDAGNDIVKVISKI